MNADGEDDDADEDDNDVEDDALDVWESLCTAVGTDTSCERCCDTRAREIDNVACEDTSTSGIEKASWANAGESSRTRSSRPAIDDVDSDDNNVDVDDKEVKSLGTLHWNILFV